MDGLPVDLGPTGQVGADRAVPSNCSTIARRLPLYALWAVALAIGLRRGEALGLRWADVDLANGRVVITKALSRVGTDLALRDVKTELSAASVPLPAELVAILRRHRLDQLGDTQVARGNSLGLVFTTKNGTPLEPRNVNRAFETLCRRAGVRSIRLHDLRHSCATLLFTMGVEAATVQRAFCHSSVSVTTGTYVDVIEQVQPSRAWIHCSTRQSEGERGWLLSSKLSSKFRQRRIHYDRKRL